MNSINQIYNEHDLFIYFQFLRLSKEREMLDKRLEVNKKAEGSNLSAKDKFSNIVKGTKSLIQGLDKKDNLISKNLREFTRKNENIIQTKTAEKLVTDLFSNDYCGLGKLMFAISIILDNEYEYKYENEGLKCVSNVLYNNERELEEIHSLLKDAYKTIYPNSLSGIQKAALFGVAISSAIGVLSLPVLLAGGVGASAATTTSILATKGFGDMQVGISMITAEAVILGAAMTGAAYGGMKLYNTEKAKKEFRKLTPEKEAMYLSIQCVHIQRIKKELKDGEFKEQLDEILKSVNTLKADLDYYYFVERDDIKGNKTKIEVFHNFDVKLSKALEL